MVQVDIFWSYAFGAGFAMAASTQLAKRKEGNPEEKHGWFTSPYFTAAILYLGILFAPSGVYLLWEFPSWETMHVWDRSLAAWVVALFAATNITQGVLGFYATYRLILAGKKYLAFLQMYIGYLFMFFILVHGWDGTGYKRFFSATKGDFVEWKATNVLHWLVSDVALTLYGMGVILIPVLLYLMGRWIIDGAKAEAGEDGYFEPVGIWHVAKQFLLLILGGGVVSAIVASLLIRLLGLPIGLALFAVAAYLLVFRKGSIYHKAAGKMMLVKNDLP